MIVIRKIRIFVMNHQRKLKNVDCIITFFIFWECHWECIINLKNLSKHVKTDAFRTNTTYYSDICSCLVRTPLFNHAIYPSSLLFTSHNVVWLNSNPHLFFFLSQLSSLILAPPKKYITADHSSKRIFWPTVFCA